MSFSPLHVTGNVLARVFEDKVDVSPMKLQRLLYITASEYAKDTGSQLLYEDFRAWKYGPVIETVHDHFGILRGSPIQRFAKDAGGSSHMVDELVNPELASALDRVWDSAKSVSAVHLSRVTQAGSPAWVAAYQSLSAVIDHDDVTTDTGYVALLGLQRIAR